MSGSPRTFSTMKMGLGLGLLKRIMLPLLTARKVELQTGLRLVVKIRVPLESLGTLFCDVEAPDHIVCRSELEDQFGYQVEIERTYEACSDTWSWKLVGACAVRPRMQTESPMGSWFCSQITHRSISRRRRTLWHSLMGASNPGTDGFFCKATKKRGILDSPKCREKAPDEAREIRLNDRNGPVSR